MTLACSDERTAGKGKHGTVETWWLFGWWWRGKTGEKATTMERPALVRDSDGETKAPEGNKGAHKAGDGERNTMGSLGWSKDNGSRGMTTTGG